MARYSVSGTIRKGTKFSMEVEAKSEKHAAELAVVKIGSAQGLKATAVRITQVKMVN